ncbi:MAG TPA: serine hydrolase [Bryobacteraceae bacterium]|nr:serine hydrolase [Bryobacteraceae bacterium]
MRAWILLAALLPLAAQETSERPARRQEMERRATETLARFQGTVCFFAKNLDTGESFGIRENDRVRTASTIKLPVMAAVYAAVAEGRVRFADELVLQKENTVSGSGVLTEFTPGVRLPLRDVMHLMIVVSDNTATNMVLDKVPGDYVNEQMEKLGLKETRSLRKVLGEAASAPRGISRAGQVSENKRYGLGVSTPREMVMLLEKLERGEVVSKQASKEMIEVLKRQQYKDGIGRTRKLPVASKSGALDHLRSDVGIVYSQQGRIAIAITCDDIPKIDWSHENPGEVLMADLTQILIDGLGKQAP